MKGWVVSVPVMKMISGRVSVTWGEAVDFLTEVNNNNLKLSDEKSKIKEKN